MEDPIRRSAGSHQFIEPRPGTGKHVIEISHREHHAFGFAGGSRSIENGDGIGRLKRKRYSVHGLDRQRNGCEYVIQQRHSRPIGPRRQDRIAKRRLAATDQAGIRVAQHRGQFARGVARVKRDGDKAFGQDRQIERGPADAVGSDQRAAIALREASGPQIDARGRDLREQLRACRCLLGGGMA